MPCERPLTPSISDSLRRKQIWRREGKKRQPFLHIPPASSFGRSPGDLKLGLASNKWKCYNNSILFMCSNISATIRNNRCKKNKKAPVEKLHSKACNISYLYIVVWCRRIPCPWKPGWKAATTEQITCWITESGGEYQPFFSPATEQK